MATVSSVTPPTGGTPGGTVVLIAGSGFSGVTGVTFGGTPATGVVEISATSIYALVPAHAAGAVTVAVTDSGGTATLPGGFTFEALAEPAYNVSVFDDCCHIWISEDTGSTWIEGCTPGNEDMPAPGDPGLDPHGGGTLLDLWTDGAMAINDADYETFMGVDFDYRGLFGIIGTSPQGGRNQTWTLIDPEPDAGAFPNIDTSNQNYIRGAISAGAETMLLATRNSAGDDGSFYPRITRDAGATWNDVTGVIADTFWSQAAFGSEASQIMYLKPSAGAGFGQLNPAYIRKSTDWGVNWTTLTAGPDYQDIADDAARQRLRCSADGQTVIMIAGGALGNPTESYLFWISADGGATWDSIDFKTFFADPEAYGNLSDCAISPDGNTIIVSCEQTIAGFSWPAVFVSTDGGDNFTDVSAGIQYPASVGPPSGGAPGTNPTGCGPCGVAPDGLGMVLTFPFYRDTGIEQPNGTEGKVIYANVSTDAGQTWKLCAYNADAYQAASALGAFVAAFITPAAQSSGTDCPSSGFEILTPPCVTAWTQCVSIQRRDGPRFLFTSLDRDMPFRGETYLTCGSLDPSATQTTAQIGEVGNSELAGLITATGVDEEELYGGLFDDAFVEIWLVPYENADEGANRPRRLAAGWAGKITHSTRGYKMEVLGPGGRLEQRPIVQTYTPQCRWTFGDERCTVDVTAFEIGGTVTSGLNRGSLLASLAPSSDGGISYTNGKIVWVTGDNAGQTTEVKSVDFDTGQITLWALTVFVPEAGDTFQLFPGCAQDFESCADFGPGRELRFGGFPYVPGRNAIMRSPDAKAAAS